jgi:hypothetical protein
VESAEPVPKADHIEPVPERAARHGADTGVHPGGVATAGQDPEATNV